MRTIDLTYNDFTDHDRILKDLRYLRHKHPLYYHDDSKYGPFWSITSHELASQALKNEAIFSSSPSILLHDTPPEILNPMIFHMQGEHHTRVRKMFRELLSPKTYQPKDVYDIVFDVVSKAPPGREIDFHDVVTKPIIGRHLCLLIGLEPMYADKLLRWVELMTVPSTPYVIEQLGKCMLFLKRKRSKGYFRFFEGLTDEEFYGNMFGLMSAAVDSTSTTMTMMMQWVTDPVLDRADMGSFIDEAIRLISPAKALRRTLTMDYGPFKEGDKAMIWIASANRDETVFGDIANFFVEGRGNGLSFGTGMHKCLGIHMNKTICEALLKAIGTYFSGVTWLDDVKYGSNCMITRIESAKVMLL